MRRRPIRVPTLVASANDMFKLSSGTRGAIMGAAKPVSTADWKTEVLEADKPVLVDFWAEWCGPCRMVSPVVEEIAAEQPDKLKVVKLNVDENPQTARDYGIMSIPTLMVFKGGEVARRMVGARGKQALLSDLQEFLS